MRTFIARYPLAFLTSVLGGVVVASGLGSVILGAGAPVIPVLYTQLGLYVILTFAVAFGVPEREGGAVAMALSAALPLLTFFAWLEHHIAGSLAGGFGVAAIGASIILAALFWLVPRDVSAAEQTPASTQKLRRPQKSPSHLTPAT
jgi:hypothetical protein